jgi:hypothetical protein
LLLLASERYKIRMTQQEYDRLIEKLDADYAADRAAIVRVWKLSQSLNSSENPVVSERKRTRPMLESPLADESAGRVLLSTR